MSQRLLFKNNRECAGSEDPTAGTIIRGNKRWGLRPQTGVERMAINPVGWLTMSPPKRKVKQDLFRPASGSALAGMWVESMTHPRATLAGMRVVSTTHPKALTGLWVVSTTHPRYKGAPDRGRVKHPIIAQ